MLKVMLFAGEVSGDMYGAALMNALRAQTDEEIVFRGNGGDAMRAAGCELFYHTDDLGAMGVVEVLKKASFFKRALKDCVARAIAWQPDVVVTIDFAGFNMRLARPLHDAGLKTVQYISPKVWVWKRDRIYRMAEIFDRVLCIFPFEPECFRPTTLKALYVGNPLTERAKETRAEEPPVLPWQGTYRIGLLPGSRRMEIARLLPVMLEAACQIEKLKQGDCSFVIPVPTAQTRHDVEAILARCPHPTHLTVIDGQARHVMLQATAALVASGTATLEACLMRCPTVLTYKMNVLSAFLVYLFIKVKFVGLVNIVAGREVMPELLQFDLTSQSAVAKLLPLLDDTPQRQQMLSDFDEVIARLGDEPADTRAAKAVLELIGR